MAGTYAEWRKAMSGVLVGFEGTDGCGKDTAALRVADMITSRGGKVLITEEPSTGSTGVLIRQMLEGKQPVPKPFDFQKLFVADRYEHTTDVIWPALENGVTVLECRYWLSTIAYGMLSGLPLTEFVKLHHQVFRGHFVPPDLTVILDLDVSVALARITGRGKKAEFFERADKLARIRANYLTLSRRQDLGRIVVIDAAQTPEEVANAIWQEVAPLLER